MIKKDFEKSYYADRPAEPYSDDDSPSGWADIAHYAEDNLEKAFERIEDLERANNTLAMLNANMWVELEKKRAESQGITNRLHQLIKAKEIIENIIRVTWGEGWNYSLDWKVKAEQFLKEIIG